ncbi:MAG: hypothetical protein IAB19_00840 [Proteobacteria bacterium]|uniref:Uncharacterized protein n=1 Tax=Candidatus Avisuccinivibrio stercorigallinarum TaxID=2840704 RepID=A0A9D9DAG5_9GAMM|nr:hypothetical protein [Candidatus Avisuccinivibrio stercorigallinarum]
MAEENKEPKSIKFHGTYEQFKPMFGNEFPGGTWSEVQWGYKYTYLDTFITYYYSTNRIVVQSGTHDLRSKIYAVIEDMNAHIDASNRFGSV